MNFLYFACLDCKIYLDAGYRWAYLQLEKAAVVRRGQPLNVETLLNAENYWNPPKEQNSLWLYQEVFPSVREFLNEHKQHRVVIGEIDDFASVDEEYLDWLQVGYLPMATPRYLVEVLGFKSWEQVQRYMEQQEIPAAWWEDTWSEPSPHEKGRQRFEELVHRKHGS